MWICPVGEFVSVPIHAAGVYEGDAQTCLAEYCVPSYASSIRTLLAAQTAPPPIIDPSAKMLLIAEPHAPGMIPLPNTANEVKAIKDTAPAGIDISVTVGNTIAENVAMQLEDTSVLHLACHGLQDRTDPLEAGFALGDEKLTVAKLMSLRMPKATVAFLSACESAMGDRSLPDEAVHLAAAMSFVGFRSVVGTMWNMHDADGPLIVKHVYAKLFEAGKDANYELIPRALDEAVRQLRESGVSASRWATYVHIGI